MDFQLGFPHNEDEGIPKSTSQGMDTKKLPITEHPLEYRQFNHYEKGRHSWKIC